ncbi:hypothetical protein [Neisseria animalis]|uniref:Uncharacterized protein n=1 Tax=Neisseria animalis TaxID=492 RepID=A0A5P3MQE4_NEIAN|nr:hypothetical protein [Neisseria animalis]QEY23817.1 hypothetical protein D0T90_04280 [Neisseria animalis]ROW31596.1 hypothetical protein CGZ60_09480 [Neisseria animalis]VEE09786.1 Uncharacterised protein [Neisseria animalis]
MQNHISTSQKFPETDNLTAFRDSEIPQCISIYDGFLLNEAACLQIERVIDMLAAFATYSRGQDKREERLFNTISFSSELLEQAIDYRREPS